MTGCGDVRDRLPGILDADLDAHDHSHIGTCLRCQAEISQYRRLGRALKSMEPQFAVVPFGLHATVMQALADANGRGAQLWRSAIIGGGSLLVAAAGTTAGILITRHRRRLAVVS